MLSNESLLDIENFPRDGISILGLSFHTKRYHDLIEERQSLGSTMPFKGTLREEEAYQYIKKLNETSPHPGLELLVKGYEMENEEMKEEEEEESENEKFLWKEFVEISGLHPKSISRLLNDFSKLEDLGGDISSMSFVERMIDISSMILKMHTFELEQRDVVIKDIKEFIHDNEGKDHFCVDKFYKFLSLSSKYFMEDIVNYECPPWINKYWDYRFVTCEKWNPGNAYSHIPLCKPKAVSRPCAQAMLEVYEI